MPKNLLFTFEDLTQKDKAVKALSRYFSRAGAQIVQQEPGASIKRSSGVTYRELALTFADSQTVVLRIKNTGDIYQALLNGRVVPLRYPDDHVAAIGELVKGMDNGRAAYQKKLAAAKVALPPSIRTAAPKMEQVLTEKVSALKDAIAATVEETTKLRASIADAAA